MSETLSDPIENPSPLPPPQNEGSSSQTVTSKDDALREPFLHVPQEDVQVTPSTTVHEPSSDQGSEPIVSFKITLFDATLAATTAAFPLAYLILSLALSRQLKTIIPPIILFVYFYILLGLYCLNLLRPVRPKVLAWYLHEDVRDVVRRSYAQVTPDLLRRSALAGAKLSVSVVIGILALVTKIIRGLTASSSNFDVEKTKKAISPITTPIATCLDMCNIGQQKLRAWLKSVL